VREPSSTERSDRARIEQRRLSERERELVDFGHELRDNRVAQERTGLELRGRREELDARERALAQREDALARREGQLRAYVAQLQQMQRGEGF